VEEKEEEGCGVQESIGWEDQDTRRERDMKAAGDAKIKPLQKYGHVSFSTSLQDTIEWIDPALLHSSGRDK